MKIMLVVQLDTRSMHVSAGRRTWVGGNTHVEMRSTYDRGNPRSEVPPYWTLTPAFNAYQCKKLGWTYEFVRGFSNVDRHPSWNKIRYVLDHWDSFRDGVLVMDTDAWIKDARRTADLITSLLAGKTAFLAAGEPPCCQTTVRDAELMNGGILCFEPRPEVRSFLQHVWDTPGEYSTEWPWEQTALNRAYKNNVAGCREWMKILPVDTFNTPAGTHITHCWWKDITPDLLIDDILSAMRDDHRVVRTKELVVARYGENVEWVNEYLPHVDRVTIYDKSETPVEFVDPKVTVVALPNVGREAHTYAHHFARDDLCDIIVCTQGRFVDHVSPQDFERMVRDDDEGAAAVYGRKHDALDVGWDSTPMEHFGWTQNGNHAGSVTMRAMGMTMRDYYTSYISQTVPDGVPWVEGAIFKTEASKVRRFPVRTYENIRGTLETSSNPETAHAMERFWGSMLF